MLEIEETGTNFRCWVQDPARFEKLQVKDLAEGVQVTRGKVKGTDRWEIQGFIFQRKMFATKNHVRNWLDSHLKNEIQTLLDFKAWNEYRRQIINAYIQISNVSEVS